MNAVAQAKPFNLKLIWAGSSTLHLTAICDCDATHVILSSGQLRNPKNVSFRTSVNERALS